MYSSLFMSPEAISVLEETDEFDLKDQGGVF
jgi:hypothetical protein